LLSHLYIQSGLNLLITLSVVGMIQLVHGVIRQAINIVPSIPTFILFDFGLYVVTLFMFLTSIKRFLFFI